MAPPKGRSTSSKTSKSSVISKFYTKYINYEYAKYLVFDPAGLPIVSVAIILAELLLNIFVVQRVPYTEIDWNAYMQECEGFLTGTTNYSLLRGDTGPLVYPAGFVYIYSGFYFITSGGSNIKLAQYIFIAIYMIQMFLVLRLYSMSRKVPPYVLVVAAFTSYRVHSIYVLRLFNDPIAVMFLYFALNLFLDQKWTYGSIFFSLGVSVKMNILLFAPALLLLYITNLGYVKTFKQLIICALVQLVLGAPFLLTYPIEYIKGSFDLGRIFEHKWTVNYRFLDRGTFERKEFHIALLVIHLSLLLLFASPCYKYFQSYCRIRQLQRQLQPQIDRENASIAKERSKKKAKSSEKPVKEELTQEQENFLNSFEKSLKKSVGVSQATKPTPQQQQTTEKYSIHFNKSVQLVLLPMFLCNFIGVICARSLHYQFYIWYFHSLPYLTWYTDYSLGLKFLILGLIEFCWNVYPSTNTSSILLHCCHAVLLSGIGVKLFRSKAVSDKVK